MHGLGVSVMVAPKNSLQPTPPAPLQSPALQSAKVHFDQQNMIQLSSFVLEKGLALQVCAVLAAAAPVFLLHW